MNVFSHSKKSIKNLQDQRLAMLTHLPNSDVSDMPKLNIAIIGGGASGYFAAITAAESNPSAQVTIYEQSKRTLQKVKVSGGGRCNVIHKCFDPNELATRYPRGSRELRAAFHRWQPQDTMEWFARRGIELKAEPDGRMFPLSDDSQTIIDCFQKAARETGVQLRKECKVKCIKKNTSFILQFSNGTQESADKVLIAAGSLKASPLMRSLESLGHTVEDLAPSLFAFNLSDKRSHGLPGLSVENARVTLVKDPNSVQNGPLLITHRGLSGPAILRLSAWEARKLQEAKYHFEIQINWLGNIKESQVRQRFQNLRAGKTQVKTKIFDEIPRRLWERLVESAGIASEQKWAQLSKEKENALIDELIAGRFSVLGKTTNKEEFVTCGGVRLSEVNFKTMESKLVPGLHFAGECLDIDGITGGFNFQGAWTTGRLAGLAVAR